jgi:hypothetical protein
MSDEIEPQDDKEKVLRSIVVRGIASLREIREKKQNIHIEYEILISQLEQIYKAAPHLFSNIDESILEHEKYETRQALSNEIDNLTLDGDEHPFFSEAKLYDLVGKDNARTVLSLMRRIQEEL